MNYESRCLICGCLHPIGVMCPDLGRHTHPNKPHDSGCYPLRQLTEADVRRIVREELGRAAASIGPTP